MEQVDLLPWFTDDKKVLTTKAQVNIASLWLHTEFSATVFWKNKALSFWKLLLEFKTGLLLIGKALKVMILFSTQISPFLPEN